MKKTIHFISGFPRSGSTLLCNILAQNPRFQATATSGIMDVIFSVRNNWDKLVEFRAHPNDAAKERVMRGMLDNYFDDVEQPVVFDKCRGWVSLLEMAEMMLERKAKVLVPVRDIRDVLASFEKIHRAQAAIHQPIFEGQHYFESQTTEGRAQILLQQDKPVGLAYHRVRDALRRGFGDRMYFVEFEKLTSEPDAELGRIYKFLEEEPFAHNFENVEQVTWEDDSVHGVSGLHNIRNKVRPIEPQWPKVLGNFAEEYGKMNFWWPENQAFHEVIYNWQP
jgi:sulfotransferase